MPECRYCGDAFEDEDAYLDHLREDHGDELGRIDRRRVAEDGDGILGTRTLIVGGVAVVALIAVVAAVSLSGGSGSDAPTTPYDLRAVHYHGTIDVTVAGDRIDFSRPAYQYRNTGVDAFHFEGGDGSRWHVHARGVTLRWALESVGIAVTNDTVTVDGTTYRDGDPGTSVTVEVDGRPVDPREYVLQEGDHVRVVVRVE